MSRSTSRGVPLLPSDGATDAALFFAVCALCFLATLSALAARSAYAAADSWVAAVSGEATIRVDGGSDEVERALTTLAETEGVRAAKAISRSDAAQMLEPWLGSEGLPEDIPFPSIIEVQTDPMRPTETADMIRVRLADAGLSARVDDHAAWSSDIRMATQTAGMIALAALIALAAIAAAVIAFATHAALASRRDVVDILHLIGAQDRFIAGVMERRFLALGLKAGALGALMALAAAAFIIFFARRSGGDLWLLPQLSLAPADAVIIAATPLLAGLCAMLSARITVSRTLRGHS
jgi:cell division transport system permease protein